MAMALFDEGRKRRMQKAIAEGNPVVFKKSTKGSEGLAEGGGKPAPSPEMQAIYNSQLLIAAEAGEFQHALDALDRGADPNAKNAAGTPAIMVAGISYNERSGWAVMHDINNGMKVVSDPRNLDGIDMTAELLLERGADPNAMDARGRRVTDITPYEMPCTDRLSGNKP
jgi:hypothetical protein